MPHCENSCENYISGESCQAEMAVEGCFCPEGQVLQDGICMDEIKCKDCVDSNGIVHGVILIFHIIIFYV